MLMGKGGVVGHVFRERPKRRHLDMVRRGSVEGLISPVLHVRVDRSEEPFRVRDSFRY